MPKLIPELRERIIAAAKVRVLQSEDHDFTTRQIAEDCGIAAGTVYNYFHNKEELLAKVMLEDWKQCVERMKTVGKEAEDVSSGLRKEERELRVFSDRFQPVWKGYGKQPSVSVFHPRLVRQIMEPVARLAERFGLSPDETEVQVAAELLLAASQRETGTLERILPVIRKILA